MENNTVNNTEANETNNSDLLAAMLAQAETNKSGKVTITAEQIAERMQAEQNLREEIARLQALTQKRSVGRPVTREKTDEAEIDLRTAKNDVWFKVGENTHEFTNIGNALKDYGLDWKLQTTPAGNLRGAKWNKETKTYDGGTWELVPNRYNVERIDNGHVFRQVTDRFSPLQNSEVFSICDDLIRDCGLTFAKFDVFNNGDIVYCTLNAGKYSIAGSEHESRFVISIAHTGLQTLRTGKADYVQVCSNGMMAWRTDKAFETKIKQTTNSLDKLKALRIAILSAVKKGVSLQTEMELLASRYITDDTAKRILLKSLKIENIEAFDAEDTKNSDLSKQQIRAGKALLEVYFQNFSNVPDSLARSEYGAMQASTLFNTHGVKGKQNGDTTREQALFHTQALGQANKNSELVLEMLLANTDYKENTLVKPVTFA